MALAKGAEMSDFNQAVLRCGSILAIKLGALNLLTVRSRMIKNDFTTGRPSKQVGRQTVETSSSRATMRHLIAKIDAPCPGLVVCLAARVGLDRRHVHAGLDRRIFQGGPGRVRTLPADRTLLRPCGEHSGERAPFHVSGCRCGHTWHPRRGERPDTSCIDECYRSCNPRGSSRGWRVCGGGGGRVGVREEVRDAAL